MKRTISLTAVLLVLALLFGCSEKAKKQEITYPVTEKVNQVDDYFGTKVEDPYRWLEDDKAEKVKKWVEEQNKVTFGYLEKIPYSHSILSINGIGNVTTAGLIGEVGDFRKFKTISEVLKLAGLDLYEISSGVHQGCRRISKSGRAL